MSAPPKGGEENDTTMDLLHFKDDENWLGYLVGGQPDNLDLGLSENMEVFDVGGGIWWVARPFNVGFMNMMKKNTNLMIFGWQQLFGGLLVCMCPHKWTFLRSWILFPFAFKQWKHFVDQS